MNNYLYMLQQFREGAGGVLIPVFYCISEFANYVILPLIIVMYTAINKKKYTPMLLAFSTGNFATNFIKLCACIYRPWILDSRLHVASIVESSATGYSFPSGHTTAATAFYGSLAVNENKNKKRIGLTILWVALIILTAFSRNFLGAHTGKDVITAIVVTCVVIWLSYYVAAYTEQHKDKDTLIACTYIVIAIIALVFFSLKSYPTDYAADGSLLVDSFVMQKDGWQGAGFVIGTMLAWLLDRKCINFTTDIPVKNKVVRAIVSLVVFVLLYMVIMPMVSKAIGEARVGALLKGTLSIFICCGILPIIYKSVEGGK